jgi:hypothetical protein
MATFTTTTRPHVRTAPRSVGALATRVLIVLLTMSTAAIHASLGGWLFTLNAIGYTTLAVAMVVPGPLGHVRWLIRIALIGFALATIGGWLAFGARFPLAYADKAIEGVLVAVVAVDLWRTDGGPATLIRRGRSLAASLAARAFGPR